MDKMTAKQAVDLLRNNGYEPPYHVRKQIAALIERQEADAAATRATLTIIKNAQCPPQKPEGGCSRFACHDCYHKMMDAALTGTAGAALLARLEAADHLAAKSEDLDNYLPLVTLDYRIINWRTALAAYRGGER